MQLYTKEGTFQHVEHDEAGNETVNVEREGWSYFVKFQNGSVQQRTKVFESLEAAERAMNECAKLIEHNRANGISLPGTNINVPLYVPKPLTAGRRRDERIQLFKAVTIADNSTLVLI